MKKPKKQIILAILVKELQRGYERLEIFITLYASLFASLLLNICLNQDYMSLWMLLSLGLLLWGFLISVRSSRRVSVYHKNYNVDKQLEISLDEYIRNQETDSNNKTHIQAQYFLIYIIWVPAIFLLFISGGQIAGQTQVKSTTLKTIEKNTLLIDSVFNRTNAIYEQNILLIDSFTASKEEIEHLTKQVDQLRMEVEEIKNKMGK